MDIKLEIDLLPIYYSSNVIEELIIVDESRYNYIDIYSVKASMMHQPACVPSGEIIIWLKACVEFIQDNPLLLVLFENIVDDLFKFIKDKVKCLFLNLKNKEIEVIPIEVNLGIESQASEAKIIFSMNVSTENIDQAFADFKKIVDNINLTGISGTVSCHYSSSGWVIEQVDV